MSIVRPFRAARPSPDKVTEVAAPPYDVIETEEAREVVKGRPFSFLHVSRPEVDLAPSVDIMLDPRPIGPRVSIGAYEKEQPLPPGSIVTLR